MSEQDAFDMLTKTALRLTAYSQLEAIGWARGVLDGLKLSPGFRLDLLTSEEFLDLAEKAAEQ